ncbi:MAG: mechanosensitive ion channel [Thaumarchaeota archaeon]|nr:mechanosensitive ion channel [Nitrososphaerota archaeon]
MEVEPRFIYTVMLTALFVFLAFITHNVVGKQLKGLGGYRRFLYLWTVVITLVILGQIGYIWGLFDLLVGSLTAAGVFGLIIALAILPLLTDMINGILIHLDREIDIGTDIEIDGKRGIIDEISLTRTKILNEEYTLLVPNRKFRENVVIIRKRKGAI